MAGRDGNPMLTEAFIVVGGLAATLVARRVISVVWVATTGRAVPDDPADPRVSTAEAVAFAVATGALVGLARLMVQRKANQLRSRRSPRAVTA